MAPVRIVIADDEAIIRLDLQETLEEEGYEVVGAVGRGDDAVALVRDLSPDLAILDIKMPGMDGIAAAKEIVAARWAAVLILTAFSQRDLVEQATTAGAIGYLVKPFQKSDLVPAIEVAIARFREVKALEEEVHGLEESLATRRLVDRAKGILMDRHSMSESDAFSFIQQSAMRQRAKMAVAAQQVIEGSPPPVGPARLLGTDPDEGVSRVSAHRGHRSTLPSQVNESESAPTQLGDTDVVSGARADVVRRATEFGREELADDAKLVVSELVTNAMLHGGGCTGVEIRSLGDGAEDRGP